MKKLKVTVLALLLIICSGCFVACGEKEESKYPKNAIYINSVDALYDAINNQADGQYWVIQQGSYTLDPEKNTLAVKINENDTAQAGWHMPLVANNLTIVGENATITYDFTEHTANGAERLQNLVTVFGDNVTLDGLKLVSNGGSAVNKAVCVFGKNLTIKNTEITTTDETGFAGSIYFSQNYKQFGYPDQDQNIGTNHHAAESDIGTVTLTNVKLNKGRISATGAGTGKFVFSNVQINWSGIDASHDGLEYSPVKYVTDKNFTFENVAELKVTISKLVYANSEEDVATAKTYIPEGATITVVD